jgi:hypothetical protein
LHPLIYPQGKGKMVELKLNLLEEKRKAEIFCTYETYVFVQTKTNIYNGRIMKVKENEFLFLDDNIPTSFPILFTSLKAPIVPSKKKRCPNAINKVQP